MKFPKDFVWGAAASSYQIEGAAYRDGGGLSTWDMMCRHEGKVLNGDNGDVACDHINRYQEDVDLMADLGLQAYRFSVSWPRVLPMGKGAINQKGLDFYDHLIDALLEKNITPWLTLFHWDFPHDLHLKGGWLNRDSADWFADYTALIVDNFSDRVANWCTLNEPQVYIGLGHDEGTHAPGLKMGFSEALLAAHHTLLAHGKAVQVIRARGKQAASISASHAGEFYMPDTNNAHDIAVARKLNFSIRRKSFFNNTWFSDPMVLGQYPEDGLELFGADMPKILSGDLDTICQPLDYIGTNIYCGIYVRANEESGFEIVEKENIVRTDFDWPVTPEVLYWAPKFFAERYDLPVVVTENGMANTDPDHADNGFVEDIERVSFLSQYLTEYGRAIEDGVPCLAYFQWSLLDNFEWAEGYSKRFGMVHVDYTTQQRTVKDSAYWYSHLIESYKIPLETIRTLPKASN